MGIFEILVLFIITVGFLLLFFLIRFTNKSRNSPDIEISRITEEKKELEGKHYEIVKQNEKYEHELQSRNRQIEEQNTRIHDLETALKEKDRNLTESIKKLSQSTEKFQEEQNRIRQAEHDARKKEDENRNRIWKEHESQALAFMKEVCDRNKFPHFSNTTPPSNFPRDVKPDFMVQIMDQYVIFDAKFSKGDINTYVSKQVRDTGTKYRESSHVIFPFIFFVIPGISIGNIKKTYFSHEKFHFYIITMEAFEPIIRTLKKLEDYDFARDMDPADREKTVQAIAGLSRHIKEQNAVNLLGTAYGVRTLNELHRLPTDVFTDVVSAEKSISFETFNSKDMKELRDSEEKQIKRLMDFIQPGEPEVNIDEIANAEAQQSSKRSS